MWRTGWATWIKVLDSGTAGYFGAGPCCLRALSFSAYDTGVITMHLPPQAVKWAPSALPVELLVRGHGTQEWDTGVLGVSPQERSYSCLQPKSGDGCLRTSSFRSQLRHQVLGGPGSGPGTHYILGFQAGSLKPSPRITVLTNY